MTDWYARCDELEPGQQFITQTGERVQLDRRVPGDGTDWYVLDFANGRWFAYDTRIHPGDLSHRADDVIPLRDWRD